MIGQSNSDSNHVDYHRIDTHVTPYAYWQTLFIAMFILAVVWIALMASLSWWAVSLVILSITVTLAVIYTQPKVLIYLTSPTLYHLSTNAKGSYSQWQLLWQTSSRQELWEAKLIKCRRYGRCIQLSFLVSHPMPMNITQLIWQDQVTTEAWRRLTTLARW